MKCLALILAAGLLLAADGPKPKELKLREELLARMKEEQDLRRQLAPLFAKKGDADAEKEAKALMKQIGELGQKNADWIKEVIDKHGWPGSSLVGQDGAFAAFLLVQHAPDRAFQKRCLGLMAEAVKKGEAAGRDLAYLTDRVRLGEKQKQLYGTQYRVVDGKVQPEPIEDEANVDQRRKEVGLPPLAEYLKLVEGGVQGKVKKAIKESPPDKPPG